MAAKRFRERYAAVAERAVGVVDTVPGHVVILGLGPSLRQYVEIVKRLGSRKKFCDEVWGINALGDVFACDRIFHMDDVRIQEIRARAAPESNIAAMLEWLKIHPGPIYTSNPHSDYPGMVDYPIEGVVNCIGMAYQNNTAAHAVAFAIYLGVKKITLFGCDYTYQNAHDAEKGRACTEFLLGVAHARGILLGMPRESSLMDACEAYNDRLYGYDVRRATVVAKKEGGFRVDFTEAESLPTAEEIEERYDHGKHPNRLVA